MSSTDQLEQNSSPPEPMTAFQKRFGMSATERRPSPISAPPPPKRRKCSENSEFFTRWGKPSAPASVSSEDMEVDEALSAPDETVELPSIKDVFGDELLAPIEEDKGAPQPSLKDVFGDATSDDDDDDEFNRDASPAAGSNHEKSPAPDGPGRERGASEESQAYAAGLVDDRAVSVNSSGTAGSGRERSASVTSERERSASVTSERERAASTTSERERASTENSERSITTSTKPDTDQWWQDLANWAATASYEEIQALADKAVNDLLNGNCSPHNCCGGRCRATNLECPGIFSIERGECCTEPLGTVKDYLVVDGGHVKCRVSALEIGQVRSPNP
jgi:hypothetical protein